MFALNFDSGQVVAIGGTSANSTAFTTPTFVQLSTNTDCWVKIETTAVAVAQAAGNLLVPADTRLNILVPSGARVAVIQDATGGHLSIVPILNE